MGTISLATLRDRVAAYSPVDSAVRVLEANPNVIPNLIRGQLYMGYDGDGFKLAPYKNPYYARKKQQQNPQPGYGNPDLYATGAFYRGITTEVSGTNVITFSNDSKNDDLTGKYGDEIHKLGEDAVGELRRDTLQPGMVQDFINQVGAGSTY